MTKHRSFRGLDLWRPTDPDWPPPSSLETLESEGELVLDTGSARIWLWEGGYWDDRLTGGPDTLDEFFYDHAKEVYDHLVMVNSPAGSGAVGIYEWRGVFLTRCDEMGFHTDQDSWWSRTWQEAMGALVGSSIFEWMPEGSEIRTDLPFEEVLSYFEVQDPEGLEILFNGETQFLFPTPRTAPKAAVPPGDGDTEAGA